MPLRTFKGGIHPPDRKSATRDLPTSRAPLPEILTLPMSQHLGAPCLPTVEKGDHVRRGQVVGDVDAFVSAPVHSPVEGEVSEIVEVLSISGTRVNAVRIAPEPDQDVREHERITADAEVDVVRLAGVVGLGGAAFPTSVKLIPPRDKPVGTVILNGCECEPYLTCDHRVMVEQPERVVAGGHAIRRIVGAQGLVIGVEDNKPEAAEALRPHLGSDVELLILPTRYPQGAEKQLIWAVLGKEVAHGELPAAAGALVHNVSTAVAVADALDKGKPLVERVVTVTGNVARPGNYLTLLGTPVSALIKAAGGIVGKPGRVIAGGPMTGVALADLDVPVVKGTSGVVVLEEGETAPAVMNDQPCIRCGRCSDACPMMLQPFAIGIYANRSDWDGSERYHALDCIECGCCSYVCPTRRPLVQLIRQAKHVLLERGSHL